jgi:hypothetical protein
MFYIKFLHYSLTARCAKEKKIFMERLSRLQNNVNDCKEQTNNDKRESDIGNNSTS